MLINHHLYYSEMKKGIPARYSAFRDWEVNFLSLSNANKVAWVIDNAYLTALNASQLIWAAAWLIVSSGNCTSAQRTACRTAKKNYLALLRPFIQSFIMYNTNISDAQITELGLKRRGKGSPVPAPTTVPIVEVLPVFIHKSKLFFRQQPDAEGVSRRGKPKGVKFIEIAHSINVEPNSPEDCPNKNLVSRSPQVITFHEAQAGQIVYYYARWISSRGEPGEYTNRQQFMIP